MEEMSRESIGKLGISTSERQRISTDEDGTMRDWNYAVCHHETRNDVGSELASIETCRKCVRRDRDGSSVRTVRTEQELQGMDGRGDR